MELKDAVEQALWAAVRALEEKKHLQQRMAARAAQRGYDLTSAQWQADIADIEEQITLLYRVLSPKSN